MITCQYIISVLLLFLLSDWKYTNNKLEWFEIAYKGPIAPNTLLLFEVYNVSLDTGVDLSV